MSPQPAVQLWGAAAVTPTTALDYVSGGVPGSLVLLGAGLLGRFAWRQRPAA